MFAVYIVEITTIGKRLELFTGLSKPFNCAPCLAAWTALALTLLPVFIVNTLFVVFTAGTAAPVLIRLINKLWK